MFVSDLDRSVAFYERLLDLTVSTRTDSAALLVGADRYQLYLRSIGPRADHSLGSIGIQYLIWSTETLDELRRCETVLRTQSPPRHSDGRRRLRDRRGPRPG